MKCLILSLLLAVSSFAAPLIITDPIPVSGGGTFGGDGHDDGTTTTLSGNGGGHTVSLYVDLDFISAHPGSVGGNSAGGMGFAVVDAAVYSPYFTFSVGGGSGQLTIFSADQTTILAQAALMGWVTNYVSVVTPGPPRGVDGSFDIVSTLPLPEPSTIGLGFIGLCCLWLNRKRA